MTEKWIIKNGEIVDTTNNITFDSFMEIIIVLNGQSRQLTQMSKENKKLKNIILFAYTLMSKNTISDEEYFEFYELCEKVIKQ